MRASCKILEKLSFLAIAASFNHLGMVRVFLNISSSRLIIRQIRNRYAIDNDGADYQTDSQWYEQLQPGNFLLQILAAVAPETDKRKEVEDAA